ncbi:MAG: 4Fe-4S dicluster domain-containing protein [Anaerolineae bacterium]
MPGSTNGRSFLERVVSATPGGDALRQCLQCGSCGGSCPSGPDMDASPRQIFAMVMAGMEEEVLSSNTMWYCVSCYYCTVRCPQEIPITDLMYTLKEMAVEKGLYRKSEHVDFSNSFVGYVERYGRSFELGLATRYHLTHNPLKMVGKGALGLQLMTRGRLSATPESIRDMPQLNAILTEARRIAALESAPRAPQEV